MRLVIDALRAKSAGSTWVMSIVFSAIVPGTAAGGLTHAEPKSAAIAANRGPLRLKALMGGVFRNRALMALSLPFSLLRLRGWIAS
ncbi:MAG: hypothetical protein HYY84_18275 [Deltaproteobacteria bacterium]|nr:hypothetical protein [Deltaproteobacteria bacterium]